MKIIFEIDAETGNAIALNFEDVPTSGVTYDDLVAILFSLLESATKEFVKQVKFDKESQEHLYDLLDAIFSRFLTRTFPDIAPSDFDLSDAAILYAEDAIIDEAAKKGIPFEDALQEFESKAKKYVREKGARFS